MNDLIEPVPLEDIFFSGIGLIERVGTTNLRMLLFVYDNDRTEKRTVAKLVASETVLRASLKEIERMLDQLPRRAGH